MLAECQHYPPRTESQLTNRLFLHRIGFAVVMLTALLVVGFASGCGSDAAESRWTDAKAISHLADSLYADELAKWEACAAGGDASIRTCLRLRAPIRPPTRPPTEGWTASREPDGAWQIATNVGTYRVFEAGAPHVLLVAPTPTPRFQSTVALPTQPTPSPTLTIGNIVQVNRTIRLESRVTNCVPQFVSGRQEVGPGLDLVITGIICDGRWLEVTFSGGTGWVEPSDTVFVRSG